MSFLLGCGQRVNALPGLGPPTLVTRRRPGAVRLHLGRGLLGEGDQRRFHAFLSGSCVLSSRPVFPLVAGALPVADNPTTETVRFPLGRALLENFDLHLGTSLLNVVVCRLSRRPRHFM